MWKNKKRLSTYALFAAYIALVAMLVFTFYMMPQWIERAELKHVEKMQVQIHEIVEQNDEKIVISKLRDFRKQEAFEIALYRNEDNELIYSTLIGVEFTNLHTILAPTATLFETQGLINGKSEPYIVWYTIYRPTLETYLNNFIGIQTIFIFLCFVVLLTITAILQRSMINPLTQVRIAVAKLERYEFDKIGDEATDVINESVQRFAGKLQNNIRAVSRNHTELEYALQLERERLQNMITVSIGIVHDLKTPLHQTLIENDYLLKQNKGLTPDAVEVAEFNIRRMETTIEQINEVLNLMNSDVQAMTKNIDTFDIIAMFKEIRESFQTHMNERYLSLEADTPEVLNITINKVIARLIMHNILSNAVKYARPDTEITFIIEVSNQHLQLYCINEATNKNINRIHKSEELFIAVENETAPNDAEYIYSTGNGVYLIRELATLVGGQCQLITEKGAITIDVLLPLQND